MDCRAALAMTKRYHESRKDILDQLRTELACFAVRGLSRKVSDFPAKALDQVVDVLFDQFLELGLDGGGDHHFHQAGQGDVEFAVDP